MYRQHTELVDRNSATFPSGFRTLCILPALCVLVVGNATAVSTNEERVDCLIEPMIVSAVGSAVQGVVSEVRVQRGDHVQRGESLAYLDADAEALNFKLASKRTTMHSEITAREAELTLATLDLERKMALIADDMLPKQDLDQIIAEVQLKESALQQARDNQQLMTIELDMARMRLEQRVLRSPVTGVVVEQHAFEGEFIHDNPFMTIAQLDPLRVDVVMPGTRFGELATGDLAYVYPELSTDAPIEAKIERVDPLLDPRSGTFTARLLLANPDLSIVSGQNCSVEFFPAKQSTTAPPAAALPEPATVQ